jgi:hypothetical protein
MSAAADEQCSEDVGAILLQQRSFLELSDNSLPIEEIHAEDVTTAGMLLLFTMVFTTLFYFVNAKSQRLRRHTWTLLAETLSILLSITIFETVKDFFYLLFVPKKNGFFFPHLTCGVTVTIVLQWASLQLVKSVPAETDLPAADAQANRRARTTAAAGITARSAGFGWITFWAALQVDGTQPSALADYIPLIALALGTGLIQLCMESRAAIIFRDGVMDPEEKAWETVACRADVDALALCLSFLNSQVARYYIGGVMPDPSGAEQHGSSSSDILRHTDTQIFRLAGLAVSCKVLSVILSHLVPDNPPQRDGDDDSPFWQRWLRWACGRVMIGGLSKTAGWLLLFALEWALFRVKIPGLVQHANPDMAVFFRVSIALVCSYLSFFCIVVLDGCAGERYGEISQEILTTMSVVTGFAWRRCYGLTVDLFTVGLAHRWFSDPSSGELILEIMLSVPFIAGLLPAHYYYIVPNILDVGKA